MRNSNEKADVQYFEVIILYSLSRLKGERTIYSIYHLLKGKKSAQTIQDAHLFSLTALFMAYEGVKRESLEESIRTLQDKGLILETAPKRYILSVKGTECLEWELSKNPIPLELQGWKYHFASQFLWERLSLLVQVCSHISMKETRYVPIQKKRRTQLWIKNFVGNMGPGQRAVLPVELFKELTLALEELEQQIKPDILVLRLTGYQSAGMTEQQAAMELGMDEFRFHLEFLAILHALAKTADRRKEKFPLLSRLLAGEDGGRGSLTQTSRQTLKLLNKGLQIDSIAAARGLKRSTIEDHIVEIALNVPGFLIEPYVTAEEQEKLFLIAENASTRQLRELRDLSGGLSYFKIRLVLAKFGEL
ncbi:helix-turn-helix domain-containing protein [Neobacillus piezotolerans]|nr:helix-turn-helix domain-containing protein [Neobacillus piezotolerans]